MTKASVLRISDAIAMCVRWESATLATLSRQIPGFAEYDRDNAWVWSLNGKPLGAYLSEIGVDGLIHAVNNKRVAVELCERSEYPFDPLYFNSSDWVSVKLARPQSANFRSACGRRIYHVYGKWIRPFFEIEPGARYWKMAGLTQLPRPSRR